MTISSREQVSARLTRAVFLCACVAVASEPCAAEPTGIKRLDAIVNESSAIVVGTVANVESRSGGDVSVIIDVLEQIKGPRRAQLPLAANVRLGADGLRGRRVLAFAGPELNSAELAANPLVDGAVIGERDLFFVTDSPVPGPALAAAPADSPLQRVIKELGTVQLYSKGRQAYMYLADLAWQGVEPDTVREVFRVLGQSASVPNTLLGVAGLLMQGEVEGLSSFEKAIPAVKDPKDIEGISTLLERHYKSKNPAGIEILKRFVRAEQGPVRIAAVGALARIHTPDAAAVLGPLLSDPDFEVRFRAVGGLSMFANNVMIGGGAPMGDEWPFRSPETIKFSVFDARVLWRNEGEYIRFWQDWWARNQNAIVQLTRGAR